MGSKEQRQLETSTMHLAQELTNLQCSAKLQEVLQRRREPRRWGAWGTATKVDKKGYHWSWSSYNYTSFLRTQRQPFYSYSSFEANWKGEKVSGCLMGWLKIKKTFLSEVLLSFFYTTNSFSIKLWFGTKSGFYMRTGDNQLSGQTEKKLQRTSQSKCAQKKNHGLWCSAAGLATTAFWIPVKAFHLRSMLSK